MLSSVHFRCNTLSHPDSAYFGVAEIGRDQARDYAQRKGWTLQEAETWLSPNLGYDVV
jgi:5-methyltetrahydrofolate--homocysteine methyltransferase